MADARSDEAASEVVKSIQFGFYTEEEIRRISVKRITKPDLFDAKNSPVPDGLYDPALGPLRETDSCKSCGQLSVRCPGHCGHIELAKPLYHPLLFRNLKNILQVTCFYCHNFRMKKEKVQLYTSKLDHIIKGDVVAAKKLDSLSCSASLFPAKGEKKSGANCTDPTFSSSKNLEQTTWTSLQYSEAMSVLNKFMSEKRKKCGNCGRKNPTISSPIFGWLNKDLRGSDIRANIIKGSNLGLLSAEGDRPDVLADKEEQHVKDVQSKEDGASLTDEELLVPEKASRKTKHLRDLPPEIIEQMSSSGKKHLLPSEVELILKDLWKNEAGFCMYICDIQHSLSSSRHGKGYAMFLLKVLLVPPSKFRPPAGTSGHVVLEHPQNILLSKVQEANTSLHDILRTDADHPDTVSRWMYLQKTVNVLYDNSKGLGKNDRKTSGIRQIMERKEGILRQKIMGKRVNYACRSVISPDPFLAVNEIGIPPYFAVRLTYPERVTPWNVEKLKYAVLNGADIHPGATHYKDKDRTYRLQASKHMRKTISRKLRTSQGLTRTGKGPESEFEGKVVYRHLQDGDIVLVNRQPTLHKPSMMAHVVRILKGEKTIRMHYANCSTYNADFDGDEMNVHLPQDEISRAEAINIVDANKQYIVPTSGDPIRGLIQDHIVSAVLLTTKDTFLTREEYHQLLFASCVSTAAAASSMGKFGQKVSALCTSDDIQPLPPAIWKPKPLWTGKQVITAILCHITRGRQPFTMAKDGKIPREYFGKDSTERTLHIYNNEFIHGLIDKAQFGKHGLVHIVHELYGADTAGILLSVFSRLFTLFLQMHGFTCGVDDLLIVQDSDMERKRILEKSEVKSEDVHVRFIAKANIDIDQKSLQREVEKVVRSNGESATTRLDRMMSSALNLITSEANNVLFPNGLLKPFPHNCLSLMTTTGAKGGLVNMTQISSLLGQQELEGKRVPRMVSGKTLPCFPPWDISSRAGGFISDRFLTGLRPQEYFFHCMAGRDGLVDTAIKTSRSGYLQRCLIKNLESLKVSYDLTVRDADGSVVQFMYGEDGVDVLKTSCLSEFDVLATNYRVVLESLSSQLENAHLSKSIAFIKDLPDELKEKAATYVRGLSKNKRGSPSQVKRKDLMKLMKLKYQSSLAEPGEAVGVIAAQSIGEPSTQMTLNTFHFAGRGEMNVTLGIPRLQEILMNAKENIRTPVMTCPLLEGRTREDAEHLAAKLRRVTVADIIESLEICTMPFFVNDRQVSTMYKLKMNLYPPELYPPQSELTLEGCGSTLKNDFVEALEIAITKHLETISKIRGIGIVTGTEESGYVEGADEDESKSKSTQGTEDNGGDDDNDTDDDNVKDQDADAEKRRRQNNDEMEYDDGMEKERAAIADEHDEGPQSEYESEMDQVEVDGDYIVGGEDPSVESEVETPESPSKVEAMLISEDSREEKKSETKTTTIPRQRKKKIKRVISLHFERLKFEVEIVLRKEPHILLAEIVQKTAKRVFVKKSDNIERCSVLEPKKNTDPIMLQTAGVNFLTFWRLDNYLDINKVVTNDIHAMLNTYGVEAARATIINEVKGVFDAYGIVVNIRHLSLIADFMTSHGGYRPMNRLGMEHFATSPFGKMTFETATRFIIEAANHAEVDMLVSPSASICLGQPVKMGTGCFDLMQNLQL